MKRCLVLSICPLDERERDFESGGGERSAPGQNAGTLVVRGPVTPLP